MRQFRLVRILALLMLAFLVACDGQGTFRSPARPSTTAAAPAALFKSSPPDVEFRITSEWGTGYIAEVTVFNRTGAPLDWAVEWDLASTITNIWAAKIVAHAGQHYSFTPEAWNGTIPPGGSVSFGFEVASGTPAAPTNITLNGMPVRS